MRSDAARTPRPANASAARSETRGYAGFSGTASSSVARRPGAPAGIPAGAPGRLATEEDAVPENPAYPRVSERAALAFAGRGVRAASLRMPPTVHGEGDHGFVPALIGIARAKDTSAYVGD